MSDDSEGPDWILRLSFPSNRRDIEDRVERVLFLSGSSGSTIDENGGRTVVRLYFETSELRDAADAMFPGAETDLEIELEESEKIDWLDYYEHSLEPIEIGRRWIVAPEGRLLPDDPCDRIPLVIPQERAFGTGSHETTGLCLTMIEGLPVGGKRVLDVGTGSGILAIAMEKLGARRIIAFDNDLDTCGVVRDNGRRNGVQDGRIGLFFGTIDAIAERARFDLVMMNIIPEVIVRVLPAASRLLETGGSVVLSGILREHASMVIDRASEARLRLVDHRDGGEWWCGRFVKV